MMDVGLDSDTMRKVFSAYNAMVLNDSDTTDEELMAKASRILEEMLSAERGVVLEANDSDHEGQPTPPTVYLVPWQWIVAFSYIVLLLVGLSGNFTLFLVVAKSKALRTSAYCHLTSLAAADVLIFCSAVPIEIISTLQIFGQMHPAACSALIFGNFVGINVGSLSVLTFTVERYVAVCQPLTTHRLCSVERSRRIVFVLWLVVLCYAFGWLFSTNILAVFEENAKSGDQLCALTMPDQLYTTFFVTDFTLFYTVPFAVASAVYSKLWLAVSQRRSRLQKKPRFDWEASTDISTSARGGTIVALRPVSTVRSATSVAAVNSGVSSRVVSKSMLRIVLAVVTLFGVGWLPFRMMPVYEFYFRESDPSEIYLFCAKTLMLLNCAANPFLYSFMSPRFRSAVRKLCSRTR